MLQATYYSQNYAGIIAASLRWFMRLTQAMIIERGWGCSSAQHRMQCQASVGRAMPSSPKIGAHMETTSSGSGVLSQLLRSFEDADIYLRFSVVGVVVFCILCCLICCAWSRYGSVISTLFDPQSKYVTPPTYPLTPLSSQTHTHTHCSFR